MGALLAELKIRPQFFFVVFLCAFLFSVEAANAAAIVRAPNNLGLVGYWSFDEGRGTQASDLSGNGNDGALNGSTDWVNGKSRGALEFGGTGDYINISSSSSLSFSEPGLTMSAWFSFPESFSNEQALIRKDAQYQLGFNNSGTIRNLIGTSGTTGWTASNDISYAFSPNTWYLLTVTYDGSIMTTYVDGVSVDTAAVTGNISTNGGYVGIGGNLRPFVGTIDEVRIYNRALSESEIQSLYTNTRSTVVGVTPVDRYNEGLVGHWTFDGKHTTATTVTDVAGGNDGTINGAVPTQGIIGQAMEFDGVNDYITVPDSLELRLTGPAYTITAWVRANGGYSTGSIVSKRDFIAGSYRFRHDSDRIRWHGHYGGATRTFDYVTNLQDGEWHHIVVTARDIASNQTQITIYVDGVLGNTGAVAGPITGNSSVLDIGSLGGSQQQYPGSIDDVRIYDRELSGQDIFNLYSATKSSKMQSSTDELVTSGLTGHWSFDAGTISGTNVADISGNEKNGTVVGTQPSLVSGMLGGALAFTGTTGYINFLAPLASPDDWTYAFWFYPTGTPGTDTAGLVGQGNNPRVTFQITRTVSTGATYQAGGAWAGGTGSNPLPLNNWYQVTAVWRDASSGAPTHDLYINGSLVGSRTYPAAIVRPSGTHHVNRRDSNSTLDALVDDVRIYNRALSEEEITQLYSMGQ